MNQINMVKAAQKGSKEAFISLISSYEKDLYIVAKKILHNESDCCDAVQETILKAFESISSLKYPEFFKAWLLKILVNNCNIIYRKNKRVVLVDEPRSLDVAAENYSDFEMRQLINCLDDGLKIVVVLYYIEDMPIKSISEVLNIPEGTVKSRLSRARAQLSPIFSDEKGRLCYEQ
jgi:RNA polymerase sigma-70 factor (ECF subfamily)